MAHFVKPEPIGVGIQYNPEILDWFPLRTSKSMCWKSFSTTSWPPWTARRLSGPRPRRWSIGWLRSSRYWHIQITVATLVSTLLEETAAVQRHVPLAKMLNSPWVANQCFYGDNSWLDIWKSAHCSFPMPRCSVAPNARSRCRPITGRRWPMKTPPIICNVRARKCVKPSSWPDSCSSPAPFCIWTCTTSTPIT